MARQRVTYAEKLAAIRERLEEIKARCDAATPGPHLTRYDHGGGRSFTGPLVRQGPEDDERRKLVADYYQEADREFYHQARTDLPALVGWALELVSLWRNPAPTLRMGRAVPVPTMPIVDSLVAALGLEER
jgi:hypothetical protein